MAASKGLSHIAMSVEPGALTDAYRSDVLDFYGAYFGWQEMEALRLPDRLTLAVGAHCYINIRERSDVMTTFGYEHFGLLVESAAAAEQAWAQLEADPRDVNLEPLTSGADGYRSFRFRYALPLAVEVQHFP